MIWIILAAGLGVANFIAFALLFRRLRGDLNRQLSDMRAERNSEWILRALKEAPLEQSAAMAANGRGTEVPPEGPQPVRRKRHLGLYVGGGLAALLAALGQRVKKRPGQAVAAATGVTAAAATVMLAVVWSSDTGHPPSSAPPTATTTATVTGTARPSPSAPPATVPQTPSPPAEARPTSTRIVPLAPSGGAADMPIGKRVSKPPAPDASSGRVGASASKGRAKSPAASVPQAPSTSPPKPSQHAPTSGRCLRVKAASVAELALCLLEGR